MHKSDAGFAQFTDHTGKLVPFHSYGLMEVHCVPLKLYQKVTDTEFSNF